MSDPAYEYDENEICAVCTGCGRLARGEFYCSTMPDGETLYWMSLCTHEYEPGDVITCRCGMLCPWCMPAAEIEAQRQARKGRT